MATVNLAAAKIGNIVLGWPMERTLLVCAVMTIFFASVSRTVGRARHRLDPVRHHDDGHLRGRVLRAEAAGGRRTRRASFAKVPAEHARHCSPTSATGASRSPVFILPLTVQWWSVWYPGAEPGGGSYIAQRMLASKTEKDAVVGTLLFNVMHYALRPWPWIIVALASTIIYPQLSDISADASRSSIRRCSATTSPIRR